MSCTCPTCIEGRALFVPGNGKYWAERSGCWHWEYCERWVKPETTTPPAVAAGRLE